MTPSRLPQILFAAGFIILLFLPVGLENTDYAYWIRLAGIAGLSVLLALGLNIVIGFVGLLDLGFMAFYAIGAYTSAILAIHGVPFIFCVLASIVLSIAFRFAIGFPALRLRGDYLAIVTLGFGEVVRLTALNLDGLTNGPKGLPRIGEIIPAPSLFGFALTTNTHFFYLILACVVLAVWVSHRLNHSRVGRAWVAIREDEMAAELMGVEVTRQKLVAFGLSAGFAGLAGSIFAFWEKFVTPESFTFWESSLLVCAVVLGGMGSVPGVIMGAVAVSFIPEILRGIPPIFGVAVDDARYLIFGIALVLMVIFRPEGLWPSRRRSLELHREEPEERSS